jgi:hypothetical protein
LQIGEMKCSMVVVQCTLSLFCVMFVISMCVVDNVREEFTALIKDFAAAWDCVRLSLINYSQSCSLPYFAV